MTDTTNPGNPLIDFMQLRLRLPSDHTVIGFVATGTRTFVAWNRRDGINDPHPFGTHEIVLNGECQHGHYFAERRDALADLFERARLHAPANAEPSVRLAESELRAIVNSLHVAQECFTDSALVADRAQQPRVATQLRAQRAEAYRLAEKITARIG